MHSIENETDQELLKYIQRTVESYHTFKKESYLAASNVSLKINQIINKGTCKNLFWRLFECSHEFFTLMNGNPFDEVFSSCEDEYDQQLKQLNQINKRINMLKCCDKIMNSETKLFHFFQRMTSIETSFSNDINLSMENENTESTESISSDDSSHSDDLK